MKVIPEAHRGTEFAIYVLIFCSTIVIYNYFTNNIFEKDMRTLILI